MLTWKGVFKTLWIRRKMQLEFKKAGDATDMEVFRIITEEPKHNQRKKELQESSGDHYYNQL